MQHRREAWHACCRPQAQTKGRASCSENEESKWTAKAETEQSTKAELPSHTPLLSSQPTYKRYPFVLCHLQGTLILRQTFPTLSVFPKCLVLPSILTSLLQRLGAGSPCFARMSACVFCSQHLSQGPIQLQRRGWLDGVRVDNPWLSSDPKWAMTIVSKATAAWVGSGC